MAVLEKAIDGILRLDSWVSHTLGYGTAYDKSQSFYYERDRRLSHEELDALFNGSPLAQTIVSAIVDDGMRPGWSLDIDGVSDASEVVDYLESEWKISELVSDLMIHARLHGSAALHLLTTDGTDVSEPIREGQYKLNGFELFGADEMFPHAYISDVSSPDLGKIEAVRVNGLAPSGVGFGRSFTGHRSRFVFADSGYATKRTRQRRQGWGEPVLQRVYKVLERLALADASMGMLLSDFGQAVYKIQNHHDKISNGVREETLRRRLQTIDRTRSTGRAIALAPEEDFYRVQTQLTDLPQVYDRLAQQASLSSGIPITRIYGTSPAGLNSTGEGDHRSWVEKVLANRQRYITPRLRSAIEAVRLSNNSKVKFPAQYRIEWGPVWQPTPSEEASLRLSVAQADSAYLSAGVYSPDEVAFARSQPRGWEQTIELRFRDEAAEQDAVSEEAGENLSDEAEAESPAPADQANIGSRKNLDVVD